MRRDPGVRALQQNLSREQIEARVLEAVCCGSSEETISIDTWWK